MSSLLNRINTESSTGDLNADDEYAVFESAIQTYSDEEIETGNDSDYQMDDDEIEAEYQLCSIQVASEACNAIAVALQQYDITENANSTELATSLIANPENREQLITEEEEKTAENKKGLVAKVMDAIKKFAAWVGNLFSKAIAKLEQTFTNYTKYAAKHKDKDFSKSKGVVKGYEWANAPKILKQIPAAISSTLAEIKKDGEQYTAESFRDAIGIPADLNELIKEAAGPEKDVQVNSGSAKKALAILAGVNDHLKSLKSLGNMTRGAAKQLLGEAKKAEKSDNATAKIANIRIGISLIQQLTNAALSIVRDRASNMFKIAQIAVKTASGKSDEAKDTKDDNVEESLAIHLPADPSYSIVY